MLGNPDVAIIALSGQKHLIFRAQPGWWQIEEKAFRPFALELCRLMPIVNELYGGFSKGEIETGNYSHNRIINFGFEQWRELEAQIKPLRGGIALQLAIFLTQKEIEEDGQLRDGENVTCPDMARDPSGLQAPLRQGHLAAIRGQCTGGGVHVKPEQVLQLDLF
jgi:hypothetical protein